MNANTFMTYLVAASYWATKATIEKIAAPLPFTFKYNVSLNQSCDTEFDPKFKLYPEDTGKLHKELSINAAVELLSREGKNPVWIDIFVETYDSHATTLHLVCSGRYTSDYEEMYYSRNGTGPFGIKVSQNSANMPKKRCGNSK